MSNLNILEESLGCGIKKQLCVSSDVAVVVGVFKPIFTTYISVRGSLVNAGVHNDIREARAAYAAFNTRNTILDAFISHRISAKLDNIQKLPRMVGRQKILDACEAVCDLNFRGKPYLRCSPPHRGMRAVPGVSDSLSAALAQFEEHDYYDTDYKALWNPEIRAKCHKRKVRCKDFCDKIYLVPLIGVYATMLWEIGLNITKPVYAPIVANLWQLVHAIRSQKLLKEDVYIRVGRTYGVRGVVQVPPTLTKAEIEKQRRAKCAELCYDYEKLYRKHTKE